MFYGRTQPDLGGMNVDDAVVISLPSRAKRLRAFHQDRPVDQWPFPSPRVEPGVVSEPPRYWRSTKGAWGCRCAHLNVLTQAWRSGVRSLLVLEDDAIFLKDFGLRFRQWSSLLPETWDMVMLGGEHWQEPQWDGHVQRCVATTRTHGYIIRDKAMPLLIRTWEQATTHIDHYLPGLQQTMMRVYCPAPLLVGQRAGDSDTSGLAFTDNRFWDSHAEMLNGLRPDTRGQGTRRAS